MVAGFVVMRAAVIVQWSRAAVQDTVRRSTALWHAGLIAFAQLLWVLLTTLNESAAFVPVLACALVVELAGPAFADRQNTTPWNPSHIAERYGLFVIIALGEGITGTVSAVAALVEGRGWTDDAVLTVLAGTAITFGLWWVYFLVPSAPVLARFRTRAWVWGYLHIPLLAAVAAEGAGFDLAAVAGEEGRADGDFIAVCVVAASCAVFIVVAVGLFAVLVRQVVLMQVVALVAALIPVCAGVAIAGAGISVGIALLCVALGPVVLIVSSEAGRARSGRILERALA
jgi:low temperature requirement protein LtrA